jgi:glycosyltransferase involved in cell wall biosynthesis
MKICQLCAVDFTLYHFILPLMRAERAAGHDVVGVCADGPWLAKIRAEGFRVESIPFERSVNVARHARAYRCLVALFRRENFDMVHTHTPVASVLGRLAARVAHVQHIVYTAHGFYFHDRMPAWKRAPFVALERWAGRATDVLFTQAAEDAETARRLRLCRGGVIEAIGNGVDPVRFASAANDAEGRRRVRGALATPDDAVVIVMVGRLVAEKGYPELFEAMASLDAVLWAAGERLPSDHAAAIDTAIRSLERDADLAGKIRLLGHRTDLPELLRAADIFVLPSHREGMPRAIIEAMMAGLPVVATDIRGSREEVVDGETGLLVPVGEPKALGVALERLTQDPALRRRLGDAGCIRALAFYDESLVIGRQLERLGLARSSPSEPAAKV